MSVHIYFWCLHQGTAKSMYWWEWKNITLHSIIFYDTLIVWVHTVLVMPLGVYPSTYWLCICADDDQLQTPDCDNSSNFDHISHLSASTVCDSWWSERLPFWLQRSQYLLSASRENQRPGLLFPNELNDFELFLNAWGERVGGRLEEEPFKLKLGWRPVWQLGRVLTRCVGKCVVYQTAQGKWCRS